MRLLVKTARIRLPRAGTVAAPQLPLFFRTLPASRRHPLAAPHLHGAAPATLFLPQLIARGAAVQCGSSSGATLLDAPETSTTGPSQFRQVLYVANINRRISIREAQDQLQSLVPNARHVQVIGFNSKSYVHPKGFLHKGFGYVILPRASEVQHAAAVLTSSTVGGLPVEVSQAVSVPNTWRPDMLRDEDELEEERFRRADFKGHRRRNKERRTLRHIDSLDDLISALPPPGGPAVMRQYQQLVPGGSDQAGQYLDWGQVPEPCNPAWVGYGAMAQSWEADSSSADDGSSGAPAGAAEATETAVSTSASASTAGAAVAEDAPAATYMPPAAQAPAAAAAAAVGTASAAAVGGAGAEGTEDGGEGAKKKKKRKRKPGRGSKKNREPGGAANSEMRGLRKHVQVESFALALVQLLQFSSTAESSEGVRVVDFGCGTGNLVLPLAALFPSWQFHAVDLKERSVRLLLQRAKMAGLDNVTASVGGIEDYSGGFDVALALHACGNATDFALLQAAQQRAAFIVSPCCVGKLQLPISQQVSGVLAAAEDRQQAGAGGIGGMVEHPRSQWMTDHLPQPPAENFSLLAAAADYSHRENHSHPELAQLAKANIEMDRLLAASEAGYHTALLRLLQPAHTTKVDVLVGAPVERVAAGGLTWVWEQ